jgi:hypothetical protein
MGCHFVIEFIFEMPWQISNRIDNLPDEGLNYLYKR